MLEWFAGVLALPGPPEARLDVTKDFVTSEADRGEYERVKNRTIIEAFWRGPSRARGGV